MLTRNLARINQQYPFTTQIHSALKPYLYAHSFRIDNFKQMTRQIHNIKVLKENRRALRNNLTPAEAALWKTLQRSQLDGRKFRRQHSVDGHILDFYCASERLAVELDGAHHYTANGIENDAERTAALRSYNIQVIRFENKEVFEQLGSVLERIRHRFLITPDPIDLQT